MKKITLLLFVFIVFNLQSFGQTSNSNTEDKQKLLKIKSVLEKHFAGTNIRSLQKGFEIKQTQSNVYSFISEVNGLFSEKSQKELFTKLNRALKLENNTKLTGTLYFDDRLDSALVDIEYKREDTVYTFVSMSGYAVPRGGFKGFSKRMHDFIKEQVALGRLVKDSVQKLASVNLLINGDGRIKQHQQNYLSKAITTFLASEPRWNPTTHAGMPVSTIVNFSIIKYYINGDAWPSEDNLFKGYRDYNDFEGYVNIYTIAFLHNQNKPVFYSGKLLQHSGKIIVSAVYDNMLKEYRMIAVHNGTLNDANKLINLIRKEASKKFYPPEFNFSRIYFMLD